jgi:hypothetical protein
MEVGGGKETQSFHGILQPFERIYVYRQDLRDFVSCGN